MRNTLIEQSYSPNVTRLGLVLNSRGQTAPGDKVPRTGPMRSNPVPFNVIANDPAIVIAVQNPDRKGLLIQNLDVAANLFVGFGTLANARGFALGPLGYILLDFVCPTDAISVFATANVNGYFLELAPIAE